MAIPKSRADHDEIQRRWMADSCTHHELRLVQRLLRDGRVAIVKQCLRCGAQKDGPVKRLPEHDTLPEYDGEIFPAYDRQRKELYRQLVWDADVAAYKKWMADYDAYLTTPEWKEKSRLVIERENHLCQGCRKAKATQAHHSTYQHAGEEFLFQLVALCWPCHKRFHADFVSSLRPTKVACSLGQESDSSVE